MSKLTYAALKAANRLPSPPAVALRILQLVASDDATLDELAHVISADPALTAKIMKYLHSPLIGLGFHGTTLTEAIARIGTRGAQLLALSFSLVSQRHQQSCPSFDFDRFWSESLARAVAARRLATVRRGWDAEEAFIAGLVLRLGRLALATAVPADYEPLLAAGEENLAERERAAFGGDHLELGLQLLQDWKLPESVWRAVAPLAGRDPAADGSESTKVLRLADAIAQALARGGGDIAAILDRVGDATGLDREGARALVEQMMQDWAAYGELLSIPTGEPPDLDAIEIEAEEQRTTLRLAAELEVLNLRNENQQLTHLANRDRLTGLLNRGAFDEALAAAVAAAARGRPVTLLMLDLDHFKAVNDRHGHPVGDEVLRHCARILHDCARAPAEAFRYGGEEFAVLVPEANPAAALALAETVRRSIAASPLLAGQRRIPLTVSIGLARIGDHGNAGEAQALVAQADECLYAVKRAGGNACRALFGPR